MGTAPATVSVGNPEGHERSCYPDELSCPDVSDPTHSVATMNQKAGSSVITQPLTFDDADIDPPLSAVEFVVVDLETTGGSPADCGITEIGAVRSCGGHVTGEFHTLVNPQVPIPSFIAALTGITDTAVAEAPRIEQVLDPFLAFARGAVLVAHNAPFDVGFLKAACKAQGLVWPAFPVVDTARLARVLLHRDEVPNHRLGTLARHFRASTTPDHRALHDARATLDVLHGLLERASGFGAHHLGDLSALTARVRPEQRAKRTLAQGLPTGPGVYRFVAPDDRTLYVGKATSIRQRVRNYFTAGETRGRILEMVRIADRVTAIECATELEAAVREVRLIATEQPPYNRRSRNAEKYVWLRMTDEPAPRLSVVRELAPGADLDDGYLGPFSSRRLAVRAAEALQSVYPLRTCSPRLSPARSVSACIRADLGSCAAPCRDASAYLPYRAMADKARAAMTGDCSPVVNMLRQRMADLAVAQRFEDAAELRDTLQVLLTAAHQGRQLAVIGSCAQIVAAAPDARDWTIHVIKHGRLAAAARARPDDDPAAVVAAAIARAEHVPAPDRVLTAASPEEGRLVLRWLFGPGVRLVQLDGHLALPRNGAQPALGQLTAKVNLRRHPIPG